MTTRVTQTTLVLEVLRERRGDGLTALEAITRLGVGRLAARVADLREEGHDIVTEWATNADGDRFGRYVLVEQPAFHATTGTQIGLAL